MKENSLSGSWQSAFGCAVALDLGYFARGGVQSHDAAVVHCLRALHCTAATARFVHGRLPDFSFPKAPRRTGSVPWLRCRCRSRTLPGRSAIYCRILAGRLRCDGAVPCNLAAATPQKSLPWGVAPPCSLPLRVGLVLKSTCGGGRRLPYASFTSCAILRRHPTESRSLESSVRESPASSSSLLSDF